MQQFRTSISLAALLFSATACVATDDTFDDLDEGQASDEAEAVTPHTDTFIIESKLYIAPIATNMIGSIGIFQDGALALLASTVDLMMHENPLTGAKSEAQFRVWAHLKVRVKCLGTSVQDLTLLDPQTDAGFEGILKGEVDPLQVARSTGLPNPATGAGFTYVASGRPNIAAEAGFAAVIGGPRTVRTIWHQVKARAVCDNQSKAKIVIDSVPNSNYPSVRVWVAKNPATDVTKATDLVYQEAQGKFSELFFLGNTPRPTL